MAVACVFLGSALESATQYVIKLLVDTASQVISQPGGSFRPVWFWAMMYAAVVFLRNWSWRGSGFSGMRWLTGAESNSYRELFEYLTGHSTAFFSSRFAGALSNKISNAAGGVEHLLATCLWGFLPMLAGFAANAVVVFTAHPLVAAVFSGWILGLIGVNALMVRRLSRLSFESAEASSNLKGKIVDTSTNISSVQQCGQMLYEHDYVGGYIDGYRGKHLGSWWANEWVLVLNNFLVVLFVISVIATALYLLQLGRITIGSMVMIISMVHGAQFSLTFMGMTATQAIQFYGQIREGLQELLLPHEIVDLEGAPELEVSKGLIEFKGVTFAYHAAPVIESLNLAILPG